MSTRATAEGRADARPADTTVESLLRHALAALAVGAAAIHWGLSPRYLDSFPLFATFFICVALAQMIWGPLLLSRPSRALYAIGAIGNALVVATWLLSRAIGPEIGAGAGEPPRVGVLDATATAFEVLVVLGALVLLHGRLSEAPLRRRTVWAATAAVALLVLPIAAGSLALSGEVTGSDPSPESAVPHGAAGHDHATDHGRTDHGEARTAAAAKGANMHRVSALDDVFKPRRIVIEPGDTLVWENEGRNAHTVTAGDGAFDSGNMPGGAKFTHTFEKKGVYFYYCVYHGAPGRLGMWGVVVVAEKGDAAVRSTASVKSAEPPAATGNVVVGDDLFRPQKLQIRPGDTVVWGHSGARPHTVTADTGAFDSGTIQPGQTYSHRFEEEGAYFYYCRLHGAPRMGMWGVIVVSRSSAPVAVPLGDRRGGGRKVSLPRGATVNHVAAADGDVFTPQTLAIGAGDIVVWTNRDSSVHTVTSATGSFDSGTLSPGGRFAHTFRKPGRYVYYCRLHGSPGAGMWGVISVKAAGQVAGGEAGAQQPQQRRQEQPDNSGPGNAEDRKEPDNSGPGNAADRKEPDNSGPGNAEDRQERLAEARGKCDEEMREARESGDPEEIEEAERECEELFRNARRR